MTTCPVCLKEHFEKNKRKCSVCGRREWKEKYPLKYVECQKQSISVEGFNYHAKKLNLRVRAKDVLKEREARVKCLSVEELLNLVGYS